MLHHHNSDDQESELSTSAINSIAGQLSSEAQPNTHYDATAANLREALAQSAACPAHDAHIEDFLDRVFARLVAVLPYEERQARRETMRSEIEQSVAAHIELGSTRDEALALTLAQIQRKQAVANQAVQPIQQVRARPEVSARPSTAIAAGIFGLFYLLDQTRIAGHLWNMRFGGMYDESGEVLRETAAVTNFYRFELLVLPLICGLAVGLLARHRPARGTLNALALLAIPAIVWGGIFYGLTYAGLLPSTAPGWLGYIFPNPMPAVCGIGAWALLGALSAGAGGWLRRRLPRAAKAVRTLGARGRRLLRRQRATSRHEIVSAPVVSAE